MVESGAKVNVRSSRSDTPLFLALYVGHIQTARILVRYGADVNAVNGNGYSPLMESAAVRDSAFCKLLIDRGANVRFNNVGFTALLRACQVDCEGSVKLLLRAGADPNVAESFYGDTPLKQAVVHGNQKIVHLLVASGADVNLAGRYGFTPLMAAVVHDRGQICKYLLTHGAATSSINTNGESALSLARESRRSDMIGYVSRAQVGGSQELVRIKR
jgi:ankyrin repeat protein